MKNSVLLIILSAILILFLLGSCGPATLPESQTATPSLTASPDCPPENWPCPSDSLTLTAEMALTLPTLPPATDYTLTAEMATLLAATPSITPPAWATIYPAPGDLGWGAVYGKIVDGVTGLPIEGATIACEQQSDSSPYLCNGVTTTNSDGDYSFIFVFFRETDIITLHVESPGYTPLLFQQSAFERPEFHADLGLFPVVENSPTPTSFNVMCTPPPCTDGVLVCGSPDGCALGCGAICLPSTPTP